MDVQMPVMDGFTATLQLREQGISRADYRADRKRDGSGSIEVSERGMQ